MTALNPRAAAIFVFAIAFASIAGAWGFEIIGGLEPCALCLLQRKLTYAAMVATLPAMFLLGKPRYLTVGRVLLAGAGLGFFATAAVAGYHAGVEWHFWPGPSSCSGGAVLPDNAADLLQSLDSAQVVRCDEAAIRIFGLSLAGYNALISLGLAVIAFFAAACKN